LDTKGLTALWREALLARAVLEGKTTGYKNHPQLIRFKKHENPINLINKYLEIVYQESVKRGFKFDETKLVKNCEGLIPLTIGQLLYEFEHLKNKLIKRDFKKFWEISEEKTIKCNPIFVICDGEVEDWEIYKKDKE